jgi:hypothetical protein
MTTTTNHILAMAGGERDSVEELSLEIDIRPFLPRRARS